MSTFNYDDMRDYILDEGDELRLVEAQTECTLHGGAMRTGTYTGRFGVLADATTKNWFLPALAARCGRDDPEAQQRVVQPHEIFPLDERH
jgi:hypothetical protein